MNTIPETKACETCAKSKRKCGKERPRCHRCSSRDIDCVYPPARPSCFVRLRDDQDTPVSSISVPSTTPSTTSDLWDPSILLCPLPEFDDLPLPTYNVDVQVYKPTATAIPTSNSLEWFMASRTWESIPQLPEVSSPQWTPPYANATLKRFLKDLQHRLNKWVTEGGNDFLHKHLYAFRNPRCIQDAQTMLALYLARNPETEDAVFRTLRDRARQLLDDEAGRQEADLDVFDHLARVHALMAYQIIGLLDGDIALRAVAETRTELLHEWLEQMMQSVRKNADACTGDIDRDILLIARWVGFDVGGTLMREDVVWHAWIFAESLRRTWVTGHGLLVTYQALQKGWATCPGSMKLTAGQGLWDATSSWAWAKVVEETKVLFIEGAWSERLFMEASPDEVDDFMKGIMVMTHGMDKMVRWTAPLIE